MKKFAYMCIHIPCFLLVALHEWLWVHSDDITWAWRKLVQNIKFFIPKVIHFIFYLSVCTPIAGAFLIVIIKLS